MTLEELRAYAAALEAATYVPGSGFSVQFGGRTQTFSAEQLRAELENTNLQIGELEGPGFIEQTAGAVAGGLVRTEEESSAKRRRESLAAGQQKLSKKQDALVKTYLDAVEKRDITAREVAGLSPSGARKTEKDLQRTEEKVSEAEQSLNQVGLFVSIGADGVVSVVRRTPSGDAPVITTESGSITQNPLTATTVAAGLGEMPRGTGGGTGGGTGDGTGDKTVGKMNAKNTKAWVDREIQNRGISDTPANRKRLRDEFKKMSAAGDEAWLDQFKQDYPAYASWTTADVVSYFGQDFIDVLMKSADPNVEYSDEEIRRMVRNTKYYQSTTIAQQNFDKSTVAVQNQLVENAINSIRETYGDLQFSETDIQNLGRTVARNQLTGVGLRQEVFRASFKATTGQGDVRQQALTGAQADQIQRLARSFGRSATNDEIQSILTGQPTADGRVLTTEGFRQALQQEAIGAFPQLQAQIDAGLSLEQIGSRYRTYAADLLEKNPEEIDMFSGPYLTAFGNKTDGPMSLGDWVTTVKSDPKFGWQYTNQANQQATDIALTLARAFGKVQ